MRSYANNSYNEYKMYIVFSLDQREYLIFLIIKNILLTPKKPYREVSNNCFNHVINMFV